MRLRFWIGLTAVLFIAAGSVAAALVVHANDEANFHSRQRDEAVRAARQAEAVASLSVGQLSSDAAFFQAEGKSFSRHDFRVVAQPLLAQGAVMGAAYIPRVKASERRAFEARTGAPIFERDPQGRLRVESRRPVYYPIAYTVSHLGSGGPIGFDIASDPSRAPYMWRARDRGTAAATKPLRLLIGGLGINVFWPVYRDGAPTATRAERRRALIGFAGGAFHVSDLAQAAVQALPDSTAYRLRIAKGQTIGADDPLEDPATARIHIGSRTWLLVISDPNRPDIVLPLLLAGIGIALAALLGALIMVWSRDERMRELQREASQDSLTGLKNRRRFEEELRAAMARSRRDRTSGALLMIDLDHFKQVNDSRGHQAGDRLIKEVASVLRRRTRASDVLARLGGDEFAVVLPNCSRSEAQVVAEAIVEEIRDHRPGDDGLGSITASIGVAMFGDDPRLSFSSLVSEADTAMYAAKDGGRDSVRIFDPATIREDGAGTDRGLLGF
jgi:diguanylate cyclase (GGDEF)-like protein